VNVTRFELPSAVTNAPAKGHPVATACHQTPDAPPAYAIASEVWFLEPFDALKRTLGLIRELGKSCPHDSQQDAARTARWFFAETLMWAVIYSVGGALVLVLDRVYPLTPPTRPGGRCYPRELLLLWWCLAQ
jgi:hypothetical protein